MSDPLDLAIDEREVWEFLQVDLMPDGGSPEMMVPADRSLIATLIVGAERRLERFVGKTLGEFEDGLPDELKQAITLDVTTFYRNRLSPALPDIYFELISSHREWGFGG
jgi:hypothetical protein